jgi:hypothetical protein
MQEEIFKDIPGFEGLYQVSNLGGVKSFKWGKEKILKPYPDTYGYMQIDLRKSSIRKSISVHKLVAIVFLNHTPCGYKLVVDHINDNPKDNRVENLQIVTQRENAFKTQGRYSSKYKGVCFDKSRNKWMAKIYINGKKKHLGRFSSEYDAHLAYEKKVSELNHRLI